MPPPKKNALIVIPTYNERENIEELVGAVNSLSRPFSVDILVVDSNSPDGTGALLEKMKSRIPNLFVYHQPKKMGLGRAYLDGFRHVASLPNSYDALITMDADFSHNPRYVPMMLEKLNGHDLVVGSRYAAGGGLENWPRQRKWLSEFANNYARFLSGVPLHDLTSGFHCFKTEALKTVLKHKISSDGYAFLIELKFLAMREGFKIFEIPIIFGGRTKGASKISKRVILESALIPWKCLWDRLWPLRRAPAVKDAAEPLKEEVIS